MLEDYQSGSICLYLKFQLIQDKYNKTMSIFSPQGRKDGKMATQSVSNATTYGHHWMEHTETKLPTLLVQGAGRSQL